MQNERLVKEKTRENKRHERNEPGALLGGGVLMTISAVESIHHFTVSSILFHPVVDAHLFLLFFSLTMAELKARIFFHLFLLLLFLAVLIELLVGPGSW
jgi:hypothetical protein